MRVNAIKSKWMTAQQTGRRVVYRAAMTGGVGALGGAIFGSLFAGFMILLRVESYGFSGVTYYFAACGMTAGILLGVSGGQIEGETETTTEAFENAPQIIATPSNRIAEIIPIEKDSPSQQRNRLAQLSRTEHTNGSALASQFASRN